MSGWEFDFVTYFFLFYLFIRLAWFASLLGQLGCPCLWVWWDVFLFLFFIELDFLWSMDYSVLLLFFPLFYYWIFLMIFLKIYFCWFYFLILRWLRIWLHNLFLFILFFYRVSVYTKVIQVAPVYGFRELSSSFIIVYFFLIYFFLNYFREKSC